MTKSLLFRIAALSLGCLAVLAQPAGKTLDAAVIETVYYGSGTVLLPSSYTYVMPSAYVTTSYRPVSYSYVVPTAYTATAYAPSIVVPTTTVYRRGLLGVWRPIRRPVIETDYAYSVLPTVYSAPITTTSLTLPVATTTASYTLNCDESPIAFNPPRVDGSASQTTRSFTSTPRGGEPTFNNPNNQKGNAAGNKGNAGGASDVPPPGPAPDKGNANDASGLSDPPVGDPQNRANFRPKATEMSPREGLSAQNVLRGEVVSGTSGQPVSKVSVVFTDLSGRFKDRTKSTDEKGTFEVFLPTGDWSMQVVDPSAAAGAKPKLYGTVTSTNGRYLDSDDRPIYSLKLSN